MIGRTLGHYRIDAKLGQGGMGVVYRAQDTHLDRAVAIKVLAPEAVANPERKRRFVQEAKAASALNHPNIVTIYDIDTADGVDFIAMEYIAGQTLDALAGRKALPLAEALRYAVQTADALATAHGAGIVHRDLKPANLMVTEQDLVKLLDFGLAKLTEQAGSDDQAPTRTMLAGRTEEGAILGTVAYMSPEQAEAKKIDHRSDIFSFGAVLYEMLTGRRAFDGESKLSALSAILHKEPPPIADAPPELIKLISLCLRKDRTRRIQHMDDVKLALEDIRDEPAPAAAQAPPRATWRWPVVVAGLLLVAAGLVLRPRDSAQRAPAFTFTQLTDQQGQELHPSLAPDGRSFLYASKAAGNWDIYLQRVDGHNPINLTKDSPADDTHPAFSPDGDRIAFRSERDRGGIFVMGATGESVRRLTDYGYHPAWSPDGKHIVCAGEGFVTPDWRIQDSPLLVVNLAAPAEKRPLSGSIGDAVQPAWSPGGHRIAYWGVHQGGQRDIWTVAAAGGEPVPVTQDRALDWNPVWSPDGGHLYFSSDRGGSMNLWRVRIEEKSGKVLGPPEPVTTPSPYSGYVSLSRDGRRLAYVNQVSTSNLYKLEFDPARGKSVGQPVAVTQGSRELWGPDLSPDGQWIAFSSRGRQEDIFLVHPDGSGLRRLTDDAHRDRGPQWSPDGKRIAFYSDRIGRYEIWSIHPDGSGLEQLTSDPAGRGSESPVWSPDGARLAYSIPGAGASLLDLATRGAQPQILPAPEPNVQFYPHSWSPDGQHVAGSREELTGRLKGVLVYSIPQRSYRLLSETEGQPHWLSDSRRLLVARTSSLDLIDTRSGAVDPVLSRPGAELGSGIGLSRDNRQIYFTLGLVEADVWLASLP